MANTRQDDNNTTISTDGISHADIVRALKESTKQLQETLKRRGSEQDEQISHAKQRYSAPLYPPATINESDLIYSSENSEFFKSSMEIKNSSHTVEIVQFNDGGCDLIISPSPIKEINLNQLPGSNRACYIITPDKQIYYADKSSKSLSALTIPEDQFSALIGSLSLNHDEPDHLVENLSPQQLQTITTHTKHMHGMAFYKHKTNNPIMSPLEAINSTAYQLLGPRHFSTCHAVHNSNHSYSGVLSKFLPGFIPNRDKPLQKSDMEISSLKNMIKKRDDHDLQQLSDIIGTIKELSPLLKREPDPQQGMFSRAWRYTVNTTIYYGGKSSSALHIKPLLDDFTKLNAPTINFGQLDNLRRLLIERKQTIEQTKGSYFKTQHQHDNELPLLNKAINQLNLILLDEITLYVKHMRDIEKELQNAWVDLEVERLDTSSRFNHLQISDGLIAPLHVSLDDVLHYRIQAGQAIGLTSRYFLMDPDAHAKNIARDGRNVDGDLAVYPLTYRFKNPGRKPSQNDFVLDINDFKNFPNLTVANFRYWPASATIIDASIDTALSQASDVTKNYYTLQDTNNYQELEKLSVFNFQKYIQLIIFSLIDANMLTACSRLHMTDHISMLNADGDPRAPMPLTSLGGRRQDLQAVWVNTLASRAENAKLELAYHLPPVQMLLERHTDLVLEMVQDNFHTFMEDRRRELNADALNELEQAMRPDKIESAFQQLRHEIISPTLIEEQQTPTSLSL